LEDKKMKGLVPLPPESLNDLKQEMETGPGYQVVSVKLKDGRSFDQVITSEGCIIAVRGYAEVPFEFDDVDTVKVNHKRWNFRRWSDARLLKAKAVSA
jgi:hypothetical protein